MAGPNNYDLCVHSIDLPAIFVLGGQIEMLIILGAKSSQANLSKKLREAGMDTSNILFRLLLIS